MSKGEKGQLNFATRAIHSGQDPTQWSSRAMVPPIVHSTIFNTVDFVSEYHDGYVYTRAKNPTRNSVEECLASLENGKKAFVFASGLGAITAVNTLLSSGDHVICNDVVYGGTCRYFQQCAPRRNVSVSFVNTQDTDKLIAAIRPETKMIWLESPTNPLLQLIDLKQVAAAVKAIRPDIITVVDNTFLTCYFQKPLALGIDIVLYSLTKYMGGHSDVLMGAAITNNDDLADRLKFIQLSNGCVPSPFDCALMNRSLRTLELRMQKHMKNGLAVAKFLEAHPKVKKVNHPYLPSHPQHKLALEQSTGHSGMVSFDYEGDSFKLVKCLKLFTLAGSLGGDASTVTIPARLSHASVPKEERESSGITDNLIRFSVGLEGEQDLLDDLQQAFKAAEL